MAVLSYNIAILGAGIMGLSAAFVLKQAGHQVCVYDPAADHSGNASAIAGGMLAPYSEIEHMPPEWITAGDAGIAFWNSFSRAHDIEFHQDGSLLLAHAEDRYILERFRAHLPDDVGASVTPPATLGHFQSGLFLKDEAHLSPRKAMCAMVDHLRAQNVAFEAAAVRPIDIDDRFDYVIDCRGMGAVDDDKNLRGVKGEIVTVHNPEFTLDCPVRLMHPRYPLYIVPQADHHFIIGATNIETQDDCAVSVRSALELLSAAYSLHPSFGEASIVSIDANVRPAYADNLPKIRIEDRVFRCNGLFRHGYLLAPVMAECVAAFIKGEEHEFFNLFTGEFDENNDQRRRQKLRCAA